MDGNISATSVDALKECQVKKSIHYKMMDVTNPEPPIDRDAECTKTFAGQSELCILRSQEVD